MWTRSHAWLISGCAWLAAMGCGSEVVVQGPDDDEDPPPVVTGGAPPTPATGAGGAGGEGGAAVTTTGVGGSSMKLCGGAQPPCPPSEYCDFPGDGCAGQGICLARPQGCTADCPGVCGCDGETYCNACTAQSEGVDVASVGACP